MNALANRERVIDRKGTGGWENSGLFESIDSVESLQPHQSPKIYADHFGLGGPEERVNEMPKNQSQKEIIKLSRPAFRYGSASLFHADSLRWLEVQPKNSIHACVTDPPYGLIEYTEIEQEKMRSGNGGVWRIPPSFDGHQRSPLPRFTVLNENDLKKLAKFFETWAERLFPVLVPGAHVCIASNPLLSYVVSNTLAESGFERRGEIIRLVMTMRGGDRPKNAHKEFSDVSVMPRSMWEPWLLFRKPLEGRVQDNLRKWKTGGLRRISDEKPFGDVIQSSPTRKSEKQIANHPSLKPQRFLRKLVRAMLPLGEGTIVDTFAGSGSTLAACESVGYSSVGVELDATYVSVAKNAIPKLANLPFEEDFDKASSPEIF